MDTNDQNKFVRIEDFEIDLPQISTLCAPHCDESNFYSFEDRIYGGI